MDEKIRDFYMRKYPQDELGAELSDASFGDLLAALVAKRNVYEVIGEGDSIIRERLFERLADLVGVGYDTIYELWFNWRR